MFAKAKAGSIKGSSSRNFCTKTGKKLVLYQGKITN